MAKDNKKKAPGKAREVESSRDDDEALAAKAGSEDSDAEDHDDLDDAAEDPEDDGLLDDDDESHDDESHDDVSDDDVSDDDVSNDDVSDDDGESDEYDGTDAEPDEDFRPEPARSTKNVEKQAKEPAAKAKKGGQDRPGAAGKEPRVEPRKPAKKTGDAYISDDIPDLFGLDRDSESPADYEPEVEAGIPVGAFVALLIIVAILAGGGWYAVKILDQRQAELEDKERAAKAEAEANKLPDVRYGNVALLASTPAKALILQNGNPIYAKTTTGAWTVLRTGPATRVQNIKIEEGGTVGFTLLSEGYKAYELQIGEYDWVPIQGTGDWEKVYHNIRLEPEERPFLLNCQELQALGPPYADSCRVTVTDEIMTRADFERLYTARLTGTITIESEPAGAKIFFLSKPLLQPDGTQAVTPYQFSIHGKDDKGQDKPVYITDELSVRLEKDGLEPYVTELYAHQWKCEPNADPAVLQSKDKVIPEKLDATSPDLPHHLCRYNVKVNGKLFEPKPEEGPEKTATGAQP